MWTFVVVLVPKAIEADLLGLERAAGRARGLGLERAMHPFMASVLIRGRRFDQLGEDTEPNPPDRQRGEAAEGGGGKRHAVVGPDDVRRAVLLKQPEEDRARQEDPGREQALTRQQVPAAPIDDRQGIAVDAIAGFEVAFEVGGPDPRTEPPNRLTRDHTEGQPCSVAEVILSSRTGLNPRLIVLLGRSRLFS